MVAQARRELAGLEKAVTGMRDELVNNLAKLSAVNNHISEVEKQSNDTEIQKHIRLWIRKIESALSDIKIERESRLEALSANRALLLSQINRIHETVRQLLHEDHMLADHGSSSNETPHLVVAHQIVKLSWHCCYDAEWLE